MASTKPIEYTNPLGSYQSTFEIGAPNGILLTVDVTATPFISFTDKAGLYTIVRGADPVIDDDLATKRYADSLIATPQYWSRVLTDLSPLNVGDNLVMDPTGLGTPYIDAPILQYGGNITIDAQNALSNSWVYVRNSSPGQDAWLYVDGITRCNTYQGRTSADIIYLFDTVMVTLSGSTNGLNITGTLPGTNIARLVSMSLGIKIAAAATPKRSLEVNGTDGMHLNPSAEPGGPSEGNIIINSATHKLGFYDGSSWVYTLTGPAGSDPEIQFNDGGVLGTDALFVFDKVNNHLGIGTATPVAEIHVKTGADIGALYFTNTANATGVIYGLSAAGVGAIEQTAALDFAITVNSNQLITLLSTGEVVVGSGGTAVSPVKGFYVDTTDGMHLHPCALPAGAAGDICIDSGAANALKYHNGVGWITPGVTIGGSDTHVQYNNSGALAGTSNFVWDYVKSYLGIKWSSPKAPLHIDGAAADTGLMLTNTTTGSAFTDGVHLYLASTGEAALWHKANKDLLIATNNTERIRVKNDGKIGFGIAAPASNFHFDVGTGNSGGIHITNNATSGVTSADGVGVMITAGKTLSIFNLESTFNSFMFGSTAADEKVRVYSTGKTIISDDISGVTVGATIEKLWLDDSGRNSTCIHFTNGDTGHNSASDGLVFGLKDSRGGAAWINQREAKDLEIWTNGTKRVVFASNGDVGINSATPTSVLDVGGSFGCAYYETAVDLPLVATDPYYTIVVTADGKTVTLPPAADVPRRIFVIKAMIAGAGPTSVTVEADGAEIFDKIAGLLNLTLVGTTAGAAVQNETVTVQSNSVGWTVISRTVDCHPGL